MTDIVELLPCPFCGVEIRETPMFGSEEEKVLVHEGNSCVLELCQIPKAKIAEWNTRAAYEVMARSDGEDAEWLREHACDAGTLATAARLEQIANRLGSSGHARSDGEIQTWLRAVAELAEADGADPVAFMELVGKGARNHLTESSGHEG